MKFRLAKLAAILLSSASAAVAGPPYQTDDPEPTELKHWEIYAFATADGRGKDVDGAAGLDLNYGAAKGLQLTATVPLSFSRSREAGWRAGRGDLELGAKYRFLDDEHGGWQAAIFPRAILPTSSASLGGNRVRILLPLWVQKDLGRTSIFGGGGYEINPGSENRDFWQAGVAVTQELSDNFSAGAEIVWQSPDVQGGRDTTGLNLGLIRRVGGPYSVMLAAGPSLSGGKTSYHSYAALALAF